jgi:hypothetical protein
MRREGYLFPETLAWAYPAAMSKTRIKDYSTNVWSEINETNPLEGNNFKLNVLQSTVSGQSNQGTQPFGGGMPGSQPFGGGISGSQPFGGGMVGSQPFGGGMVGNQPFGGGMPGSQPFGGGLPGGQSIGGQANDQSAFRELELPEEIQANINGNYQSASINEPVKIPANKAITESQAVACYASASGLSAGQFVLGFDVGGSTTDLLAVTGGLPGLPNASALVKQNSIKLAAGILADATKFIPGFNSFLKDYVSEKIGKIYGIENITPNTAPYFFNTVLDRLDKNEDLDNFYLKIASNSKPLMWLNLYVTGLNMFYGGMVVRKLQKLTENNINIFVRQLYSVRIEFYGKGSRIFDWYKALDAQNAESYLKQCFANGFGQQEVNNTFKNQDSFKLGNFDNFKPIITDNIKTEVAKGLALKDFTVFEFPSQEEIAGEEGYLLRVPGQSHPIPLEALMNINPSLIQRLGSELLPPQPGPNAYPKFVSFMNTFYTYATQTLDFKADGQEIMSAIMSMNILNDLRNDEDYKEALKNGRDFDFVAPLIILQGQAFLRSYLLPKIQRG